VAVYCSPITYLVAGFDLVLSSTAAIPIGLTWVALIAFSVVFVVLASVLHRRNLMKGL
jgi:ABC-type multidrug transport system permease subunit